MGGCYNDRKEKCMFEMKEKLIHLLGGVTKDEHKMLISHEHSKCLFGAYNRMLEIMDKAYGMPADQWAKHVYDKIALYRGDCKYFYESSKSRLKEWGLL